MATEGEREEIYVNLSIIGLFLDMVARALIANESVAIPEILAQVVAEYELDAAELNWPEDVVFQLSQLHAALSRYVDHHMGQVSL